MSRKTTDNPTLAAMIAIDHELDPLSDAGKAQVLRWVLAEYGHVLAQQSTASVNGEVVDDAEVFDAQGFGR